MTAYEGWAIVEFMGSAPRSGRVSEAEGFGVKMMCLTGLDQYGAATTSLYNGSEVRAIHACDEVRADAFAALAPMFPMFALASMPPLTTADVKPSAEPDKKPAKAKAKAEKEKAPAPEKAPEPTERAKETGAPKELDEAKTEPQEVNTHAQQTTARHALPGETYAIAGEDVDAHGNVKAYRNSQHTGAAAPGAIPTYPEHPPAGAAGPAEEQADATPATDEVPEETAKTEPEDTRTSIDVFLEELPSIKTWADLSPSRIGVLYRTEDWAEASDKVKAEVRAKIWVHISTVEKIDPGTNCAAYMLWLFHETDPDVIEATFRTVLMKSESYARATDAGRQMLSESTDARLDVLRGE